MMYRRMGPKELEKLIEEVKERKELKLKQDSLHWEFNTDTQKIDLLWILETEDGKYYQKTKSLNVLGSKHIWNKAIEAAALIVQPVPHVDEERKCEDIAKKIRELKKQSSTHRR